MRSFLTACPPHRAGQSGAGRQRLPHAVVTPTGPACRRTASDLASFATLRHTAGVDHIDGAHAALANCLRQLTRRGVHDRQRQRLVHGLIRGPIHVSRAVGVGPAVSSAADPTQHGFLVERQRAGSAVHSHPQSRAPPAVPSADVRHYLTTAVIHRPGGRLSGLNTADHCASNLSDHTQSRVAGDPTLPRHGCSGVKRSTSSSA